jgi:hypothetical protein
MILLPRSTKTAGTTEHAQSPSKAIRHLKYVQGDVNIPVQPSQSWCDRKEVYRCHLMVGTVVDKIFVYEGDIIQPACAFFDVRVYGGVRSRSEAI